MSTSPESKRILSVVESSIDPLALKRAEILAKQSEDTGSQTPSIREELAWIGFRRATKRELQNIILKAMERDPEA